MRASPRRPKQRWKSVSSGHDTHRTAHAFTRAGVFTKSTAVRFSQFDRAVFPAHRPRANTVAHRKSILVQRCKVPFANCSLSMTRAGVARAGAAPDHGGGRLRRLRGFSFSLRGGACEAGSPRALEQGMSDECQCRCAFCRAGFGRDVAPLVPSATMDARPRTKQAPVSVSYTHLTLPTNREV